MGRGRSFLKFDRLILKAKRKLPLSDRAGFIHAGSLNRKSTERYSFTPAKPNATIKSARRDAGDTCRSTWTFPASTLMKATEALTEEPEGDCSEAKHRNLLHHPLHAGAHQNGTGYHAVD